MTQSHDTTRPALWGLLLLVILGAGLLVPTLALADSTSRTAPPARYRGPANEVSGGLSSLFMPRPVGNRDDRSSDDWARWEFWFEYEKDSLLRTARERLVNSAAEQRKITGAGARDESLTEADLRKRLIPALRTALEDRSLFVRSAATLAAANAGDRESLPMLIHRLDSKNEVERRAAALSLGILGSNVAVGPLTERVQSDRDVSVRAFAALSLGLIGDAQAAPALRTALERSLRSVGREHREFQVALVTALGHLKDRESAPVLQRLLDRRIRDDRLRAHAATALGRLEDSAAVPPLVFLLLEDGNAEVRRSAAAALGRYDDRASVMALRTALDGDSDTQVRGLSAVSLARASGARAVDTLKGYTRVRHRRGLRGFAAVALGLTGSLDTAAPRLRELLSLRSEDSLRSAAAIGLGLLGDGKAGTTLLGVARDHASSPELRGYALLGAAMVGERGSLVDIRTILSRRGEVEERRGAVLAAAVLPEAGNAALVVRTLLASKNPSVRGAAVLGLGLAPDRAVVPLLTDLAAEKGRHNAMGRLEAVTALGQIARRGALPPVARLCDGLNYRSLTPSLDAATRVF